MGFLVAHEATLGAHVIVPESSKEKQVARM